MYGQSEFDSCFFLKYKKNNETNDRICDPLFIYCLNMVRLLEGDEPLVPSILLFTFVKNMFRQIFFPNGFSKHFRKRPVSVMN